MPGLHGTRRAISWIAQIAVAVILLQTLFFKFSGAPESILIFSKLGVEPWGRFATGSVELIASILILVPATAALGALVAVGVIAGAILSHLTVLGIEVEGDGGLLFGLACAVMVGGLVVLWLRHGELFALMRRVKG